MESESNLIAFCLHFGNVVAVCQVTKRFTVNTYLTISINCDSWYVSMLDLYTGLLSCNEPVLHIILNVC